MILNLKIVRVNSDYCDYLRKYDNKVSYNKFEKELRPFIGILFKINECEYFAPLSSPKPKHKKMKNTVDFFKIKNGELGAVNFNNMIPVTENNYILVDLNKQTLTLSELKYQRLLREQLDWLNANFYQVKNKSFKLYQLYNSNKLSENIKSRCCNFKLLEEKCRKYKNLNIVEGAKIEIKLICDMYNNNKTEISSEKYQSLMKKNIDYIGKRVFAKIDRPLGSNPVKEHPDFVYELNYGYIPNTLSGDGEELDCYIIGINEPIDEFEGRCIAIIHRINEDDDKLILVPDNINLSSVDIQKAVYFIEKHHKSFLFIKSEN